MYSVPEAEEINGRKQPEDQALAEGEFERHQNCEAKEEGDMITQREDSWADSTKGWRMALCIAPH